MGEKEGFLPYPEEFETLCIHHTKDLTTKLKKSRPEFVTPIVMSNLVKREETCGKQEYVKGRFINGTRSVLESLLAVLNHSKYCLTFCSGMGAVTALLGLVKSGEHIIVSDDAYGGTNHVFTQLALRFGITASAVDFYNYDKLHEAITPKTKLFWTENPTNPKLKVLDLLKCSEIARQNNIIMVVDNTFLTPYLQCPLDWGADISVQSVTKYLNGHSDVTMGAVSTNSDELFERLNCIQKHFAHVPSPFDCYQVIRGLKTLPIRLKRHHYNSLEIAKFLIQHPKIENLQHPAHPSHPKHKLFKSQTSGHSGMIAFYVKGNEEQTRKFMSSLKIFTIAVSLGGYESLVQTPYHLTHHAASPELKKILNYTPSLVRMSVGLEHVNDLIEDLEQALNKI